MMMHNDNYYDNDNDNDIQVVRSSMNYSNTNNRKKKNNYRDQATTTGMDRGGGNAAS
eukprot:Pgem_evm1s9990